MIKENKMKDAIIILPFFGELPSYFQLFLNSCEKNNEYDWAIFTNDKTRFRCPNNVKIIHLSFEDFIGRVQKRLNFEIHISSPKKLCDFKPLYGYLFPTLINGYKYWGYCDCDLIFGKISNFVNLKKLGGYSKIGTVGHLALMKNEPEINEAFRNDKNFKDIILSKENMVYDEGFDGSINNILLNMNKKVYEIKEIADVSCRHSSFRLCHYNHKTRKYDTEKERKGFFVWDNGKVFSYTANGNKYTKEEYAYIHLQKRSMRIKAHNFEKYKIIPNSFDDLECDFYDGAYNRVKQKHITFHCAKYMCNKVKNKISINKRAV